MSWILRAVYLALSRFESIIASTQGHLILWLDEMAPDQLPMCSAMCSIRDYQRSDYDACLGIFASNTPQFFGAGEQPDFVDFLERLPCPYLVAEVAGVVVGCGGYDRVPGERTAELVWGMVARDQHRLGIGTALVQARLERLAAEPEIEGVRIDTSQWTAAFYERFGFRLEKIVENHFAEGLHQYQMVLSLRVGG